MTSIPRVLVTGFEPFAGALLNSSQVVVEWLEKESLDGVTLAILPVEYDRSVERILGLIERVDPEIIISLGQAEGRTKVSFERVALNLDDARIPDNSGDLRRDLRIQLDGDDAFMANLPVRAVVEALTALGHPVEESLSAGSFVCNHLFYSVMSYLKDTKSKRWMDFIHLPLVSEQGVDFSDKPTLEKEIQGQVIIDAIAEVRKLWAS